MFVEYFDLESKTNSSEICKLTLTFSKPTALTMNFK